jgi:hypothetical protein
MNLQCFQLDLAARLESSASFASIPVFVDRPRAALTAAEIQGAINAALGALTTKNGQAGLCATVLMPLLTTQKQELPGPYLHLSCIIRVQENVIVNMGAAGTQIPCEDAAIATAQILHLWTPGGTAGIVRAASATITPNQSFEGRVTYDVSVESDLDFACLAKTCQPFITEAGDNITIACTDEAAIIYYTLDGSPPWSGNTAANQYAAPFGAAPAGTLIRAAAYNPAKQGSDIAWLQL